MAHALNLTMRIRQDADALATLAKVKADFAEHIQPKIDRALRESGIVHFARVLVIDDRYLQVITEYDGDHKGYTEFFRKKLPDVFALLFSMAENAPDRSAMGDENAFFNFAQSLQQKALGEAVKPEDDGDVRAGYLFSAYDRKRVEEILPLLKG